MVDTPRTERAWAVFFPDGAPSPLLASPLAPSPGPPTALAEVGDAVGASGSPLSTAVIFGATAIGLGCVLCLHRDHVRIQEGAEETRALPRIHAR